TRPTLTPRRIRPVRVAVRDTAFGCLLPVTRPAQAPSGQGLVGVARRLPAQSVARLAHALRLMRLVWVTHRLPALLVARPTQALRRIRPVRVTRRFLALLV